MPTMTRRQLYDLVWSKPMREAASDLGMSDVGLKKLCVRHRVPVPRRGYWNKVNAGHKPKKRAFRELEGSKINTIFIGSWRRGVPAEVRSAALEARARENEPGREIEVSISVEPTLSAAIRLEAALRRCKPDQEGFVSARGPTLFRVRRVRPEQVGRVVRLVQALLAAATARFFTPKAGDEDLILVVEGVVIVLCVKGWSERKRRRVSASPDALGRLKQRWRYEYEPTDRLSIEIDARLSGFYARRRWRDTAEQKLETMLNDVLAGLVAYAAALKQQWHEQQRAAELQEQERRRDEKYRRLAELDRARVDFLAQRLRALDEMQKLDRFLALLDASTPPADALSSRYWAFVQWAKLRLERLQHACSAQTLEALLANSPLFVDERS